MVVVLFLDFELLVRLQGGCDQFTLGSGLFFSNAPKVTFTQSGSTPIFITGALGTIFLAHRPLCQHVIMRASIPRSAGTREFETLAQCSKLVRAILVNAAGDARANSGGRAVYDLPCDSAFVTLVSAQDCFMQCSYKILDLRYHTLIVWQ